MNETDINALSESIRDLNSWINKLASGIPGFAYCDIGAIGGIDKRWSPLKPFIDYFAFEPNEAIHDQLAKSKQEYKTINYLKGMRISNKISIFLIRKSEKYNFWIFI